MDSHTIKECKEVVRDKGAKAAGPLRDYEEIVLLTCLTRFLFKKFTGNEQPIQSVAQIGSPLV